MRGIGRGRIAALVAGAGLGGALLIAASAPATVGPNVNVTKQAGNEDESAIAIDPTNTNRLFMATNTQTTSNYWRSTDDGATWTKVTPAIPAACCDVQMAWDTFGNLFIVYIDSAITTIELAVSTDGGATFTLLPAVGTGNIDQPSVAVGAGSVWVSWNSSGSMVARGAAVTGLGVVGAYNALETIPSGTGSFGDIAVGPGPSGQVTVIYQNPTGGQGPATIYANTDPDGLGAGGFGSQVTVTTTNVGGFDFIPAQSARSIDAEAGLAYDRTGGATNGRLYLVYTEETVNENNDTEILVRSSTNSGATWGAPVRVNDDATTRSQFLPHISVDQTTGNLGVTWQDSRNDNGVVGPGSTNTIVNDDAQYWGAFSSDGANTFGANFQISAGTSNAAAAVAPVDYGDYAWSDFYGGHLHAIWSDNSNSTGDNPNGTLHQFDQYTAKVTFGATAARFVGVRAARTRSGHAALTWTTGEEAGILGFDVFRLSGPKATRLNEHLIAARAAGRTGGASYRIVDRTARSDRSYTYRVEAVGLDGTRSWRASAILGASR